MATAVSAPLAPHYDAIVIGGGHNGLLAAIYMARAGKRSLVIEAGPALGGMAVTDQALRPGFAHHAHANALSYHDLMAKTEAIDFAAIGLETIAPRAQHGICFRDGRPPIILYRPELTAKSVQSLRRYSYRDAKLFGLLKARADRLTEPLAATMFSPPGPAMADRILSAIEREFRDLGIAGNLAQQSAKDLIDSLFSAREIRTLFYRLAAEFGASLTAAGGDVAFLGHVLWLIGRRRLPKGGMSQLVDRLHSHAIAAGAEIATGTPVTGILVEDRRAVGVRLQDGRQIAAPTVISTASFVSTITGMLTPAEAGHAAIEEARALDARPSPAIGSLRMCLAQAPVYRGSDKVPDINLCLQVFVGHDEPEDVLREHFEAERGNLPMPAGAIRVNSLWDSQQAPDGAHSAGADSAFPDLRRLAVGMIDKILASYPSAFAAMLAQYAPNLADGGITAIDLTMGGGYDRKVLMKQGEDQYRTPVSGLYVAGTSTHPGGGIHGACAYNATRAIFKDTKLQ